MQVGVTLLPNNSRDLDRFLALEAGEGDPIGDSVDDEIVAEDLRLGELVEELGFDSLWTVEHHFNPYTLVPDPLQWLSYWAAKTSTLDLGTMVTVTPWHNPVRVAEQIVMLQHMLGPGRKLHVGLGRGAGRREFGGLGVKMEDSRDLFNESVQVIKGLLTEERFSFQGEHFQVPDVSQRPESPTISLRPRPRDSRELIDNMHVAWGSPTSVQHVAPIGGKPLIMPQREMSSYTGEIQEFNRLRRDAGYAPANGMFHLHVLCGDSEEETRSWMPYERAFARSALVNYELAGEHFAKTKGYEHYAKMQPLMKEAGEDSDVLTGAIAAGTPDQVFARIEELSSFVHPDHLALAFKVGGMPYETAEKSIRLFAREVLPAVKAMPVLAPIVDEPAKV